ncbi:MAG: nitroreductase family protein, partial [Polaromonas sp.]
DEAGYASAVQQVWHPAEGRHSASGDSLALRQELVRYATLAPSSHNTQCWKFHPGQTAIEVMPDFSRRCPAVDPDDHHLFVSLGCATENLVQAALANGLATDVRFDARSLQTSIALTATRPVASDLFRAIPERQSTRTEFDGQKVSNAHLRLLEQAGTGPGVHVILLTEKAAIEKILAYVLAGNTAQLNDAAFMSELRRWVRFNGADAVRTGDGLYSVSSGSPSVPDWLGSLLFGLLMTPQRENDKYARQIHSSAGVAIFVSAANDPAHWVETGRCYQRFALQATALGIRNAMLNQPVEVAALRPQLASHLGLDPASRPDLVLRFGYGPKMPVSLRRPLQSVLA